MKIGIDISQIVYQGTGAANYTRNLVKNLLKIDQKNQYILFFSSLRRRLNPSLIKELASSRMKLKQFKLPPTLLGLLWNKLHIFPVEWFIGPVDVFFSSDWAQPPTVRAKKVTVVHDLVPLKFPKETHPKTEIDLGKLIVSPNIVEVQKRRLGRVKTECDLIIVDSKATKEDLVGIMGIPEEKIRVVYLGV